MADIIPFPAKPVCTNIWSTCTHDDCPLKALHASMGTNSYLGNCGRYLMHWFGQPQPADDST